MTSNALTILVVDDDEGLLMLACRHLQRRGFSVSGALSIEQARALLDSSYFDLLVIDYQLDSNMSGLDFYAELRAQGCDIPAIMCTGFSDEAHANEARQRGITQILSKTEDYLDRLPQQILQVLQPSG
jgi:DNA-binding NtrC family response regulator